MLFPRTNIERQLQKHREILFRENEIISEVEQILNDDEEVRDGIRSRLCIEKSQQSNAFNLDLLESERIYHLTDIRKICITYRLRFLESSYFVNPIPEEAISKIKHLEKQHDIQLTGFRILAPTKAFKLKNADDPLLFVPIGNGYFYLIHKWGQDLHPLRKLLMLPFKSIENLALTTLIASFVFTLMIPNSFYTDGFRISEFWLVFFFVFKGLVAIVIFYGIALGKNFNSQIWNSKYFNG